MDSPQTQLAERLKSANNILVTVTRDPSIDQLAACLGLTLLLNKMNKHSVAVFSGQVPSAIEFLKPEETIEKTTDSLRDFIIALDKDKADKLRYKVEDNVVRIFITPYKTSITEEDLEFSQGDFNVDVVVALGVKQQEDLDEAIVSHGRILHDATVASVNLSPDGGVGTINWHDPQASSLSELVTDLAPMLGDNLMDNQIATSLLTGIVAETERFSNDKTSSQTMNASSFLMAAGANQQLVATKLEEPAKPPAPAAAEPEAEAADQAESEPGTLSISHDKAPAPAAELPTPQPPVGADIPLPPEPEPAAAEPAVPTSNLRPGAKIMTEPPSLGGTLSANTQPEGLDPVTDPLSMPQAEPDQLVSKPPVPAMSVPAPTQPSFTPPPPPVPVPMPAPVTPATNADETLTQLEQSVNSPHLDTSHLDTARDEVSQALQGSPSPAPEPIEALNAQPMGPKLHPDGQPPAIESSGSPLPIGPTPPESSDTDPLPPPPPEILSPSPQVANPNGAPTVPPPLSPQAINNATNPSGPGSTPL